jgi:RND family efflux transporter MFP subunit
VLAPQTGRFEREGQAPSVGDRVREGQLLGYLLVIDRLPVRAPISGLVSEVNVTTGQWVQAGQPLMRVLNERRVRVEVPLFGEHLTKALKARTASVHLSALPGRSFPAVVRGLAPMASAPEASVEGSQQPTGSQVPPLILTVSNTDGLLRPGMLVEVSIETGAPQNVLDIPESAVVYQESGPGVFVHSAPETFDYRPIGIVGRYPGRVAITGDVKPGDRVVTEGAYSLISAPPASAAPVRGPAR